MTIHDVRFPTTISRGATGGPERQTEIVVLGSGHEERNSRWAHSRRRYNAGLGLRTLEQIHQAISFFEACRGQLHGFRWKDPTDYKSCSPQKTPSPTDQFIADTNGIKGEYQLRKTYLSGGEAYIRPITKPVAGTVRVALNGTELEEGTAFTVQPLTGVVRFAPGHVPGAGQELTAGFEFDVPVRFDTAALEINLAAFEAGEIPDIPIVEIRA
ncbi:MAG: DUF2460 domain-containing protein [Alphaproteobacteria bacterium]|nr:DUF2460 domain-containing protein [Alphaproteobacteria bacterium]